MSSRWDPDLGPGLRRVVSRAIAWSAVSQAGRQLVQFGVAPVLAILVDAEDFGLVAMTLVVTTFVMALNDLGARSALQREPSLGEPLVAGVFWLNAALGLACTAATAALSWPVARFYGEPRLVGLLQALSPLFLLSSLGFVSLSLLQRRLDQRLLSGMELVASVAGAAAAIGSALAGAGAYALVLQGLISTLVLTALALVLAPVPLGTRWTLDDVRPVVAYSLNLTAFGAVNALARNADYLLLGRLAGPGPTGLYYLAYRLVVEPVSQMAAVMGRLLLPVLAAVQQDETRVRGAYLRLAGGIVTVTYPATLGLLAVHREVLAILGPSWSGAAPLIVLLVPVGLVQAVFASAGSLYQLRGRTDLMLRVGLVTSVLLVLALAAGATRGAPGVAAAYSLAMVAMCGPVLAVPLRLVGLRLRALGREVLRPLLAAALMAAVVTLLRPAALALPPLPALLALVAAGVVAYAALLAALDRGRVRDLVRLLRGGA